MFWMGTVKKRINAYVHAILPGVALISFPNAGCLYGEIPKTPARARTIVAHDLDVPKTPEPARNGAMLERRLMGCA